MSEEIKENQTVSDQTAVAESDVSGETTDWEKKYHEEVKQSKSYRARAQDAESNLDKHNKKQEVNRKKKLEAEGKLQQIIDEQDSLISDLRSKADYGVQLEKTQKQEYLEQLPEGDRADFEDLPLNQIRKIIPKLIAAQTSRPELPSVKGAVGTVVQNKPWSQMDETERRAFYTEKANEQAMNKI
tara:strand:- start:175 stop:729 length:555 start_codon:yes stop_codon:yes gene_type:complete